MISRCQWDDEVILFGIVDPIRDLRKEFLPGNLQTLLLLVEAGTPSISTACRLSLRHRLCFRYSSRFGYGYFEKDSHKSWDLPEFSDARYECLPALTL